MFLPSTTIKASVFRPSASNLYFPANSSVTLWIFSLWKLPSWETVMPSDDWIWKKQDYCCYTRNINSLISSSNKYMIIPIWLYYCSNIKAYMLHNDQLDPGLTSSPSLYHIPLQSSLLSLHSSSAASPIMALQSESPAWKWTPGSEDLSTNKLVNLHSPQLPSAYKLLFQVFVIVDIQYMIFIHPCVDVYTLTSLSVEHNKCSFCISVGILYFMTFDKIQVKMQI